MRSASKPSTVRAKPLQQRLLPRSWHGPESGRHCRTWRQSIACRYRRLDFHSVAIGALEDGQQIAQQTRVFHRSGGGKADDLCLFGSGRNLTCINRGTVLDVEQRLTVLFKAIVCGQVQRFLGQEPLDEASAPAVFTATSATELPSASTKGASGFTAITV